ncbi:Zinc finger (C3HC4-type RING finger) family protein [Striga hermonthica]|uniref:Zinc finger (C3HC4-type RING finger) family protein n=1 Tax=Striga hermonthica TaxID=68872 RepID=A0A9N7RMN9_STRHE|nr:Zinc finger (C3HC4-type RING finger) family protein [Striga hermonthica]
MGGGEGGASWKLKKAAKKIFGLRTCASLCNTHSQALVIHKSPISCSINSCENTKVSSENAVQGNSSSSPCSNKNLCTICLDPLTRGRAIFTAQCTHAFHFSCIASNISHGSLTCPICRAHWTQLPKTPRTHCPVHSSAARVPVPQIGNFRRPVEPGPAATASRSRLSFSLLNHSSNGFCYLRVKLDHRPATDLVLVVDDCTAEPHHLSLVKRAMAAVISSLGPTDRLAIATRGGVSTLRSMTPCGKRIALRIVDRLSCMTGPADERLVEEVLGDRYHKNPRSCVVRLTWGQSGPHEQLVSEDSSVVQRLGFGLGACGESSTAVLHEFEGFLARTIGGLAEDIRLRIGQRATIVRIGEMKGGEERNIQVCLDKCGRMRVEYSYGEGSCVKTGDVVVGIEGDKWYGDCDGVVVDRSSGNYGNWNFHDDDDEFTPRRLSRHLHGMWP